ncbi:MAG TPA: hypothetical protein PL155_01010 [Candidatus Omnitrophota bacterium]|nr:hypothetical protein [Candidatus Omnitrophota bacterium]HPD84935.1 hypothetical protein [Candidatus Omnitrophota bacterium]HRZ03793.1 hypothetical protein [Candidatus Omnitrophota bacterium]
MYKWPLLVSGIVFLLIALVHLLRMLSRVEITIGNFTVPQWFSWGAFVTTALLAAWMFYSAR